MLYSVICLFMASSEKERGQENREEYGATRSNDHTGRTLYCSGIPNIVLKRMNSC